MLTKNVLYTIALGSTLLLVSACEDQLTLEPEQTLSTDAAFADGLTAQGALIGAYSKLQDLEVFGSMPQVISDYQSDNVDFIGSFPTLQEINTFNTLSDNVSIQGIWRDNYEAILTANAVIKNVPLVEDVAFAEDDRAQYVAEAKFIRAMAYFQMVNLFAQPLPIADGSNPGVPLVLEPFESEVVLPARATVNEVHAQVQQDLEEAIPGLPASLTGRATQGAAQGLLSRLHLYRGEYQAAADRAQEVIGGETYALASDFSFYGQNTNEELFSLQNSATDNGSTGSGGWALYYNPAEDGGRGDAPFSQDLLDAYAAEPGDKRAELVQIGDNMRTYTTKYPDAVTNADNIPLLRITEMYLNQAEALAKLNGTNPESVMLINALRIRAGLPEWAVGQFGSDQELVDAILVERRKELAFEGHRRMDLLRNNKPLRTAGIGAADAEPGDEKTILPVPQREQDINIKLTQNPGYGNDGL